MLRHKIPLESAMAQQQEACATRQLDYRPQFENSQAKLVGANGEEIYIPESVYQLLRQVVQAMESGQAIHIVPQDREMTTQQAADFLNVSRPFLIKLLEKQEIPYIKVGTHRRIRFQDLITYKQQRDSKRREGLKEITQFLQNEGFYDKESFEIDH